MVSSAHSRIVRFTTAFDHACRLLLEKSFSYLSDFTIEEGREVEALSIDVSQINVGRVLGRVSGVSFCSQYFKLIHVVPRPV